MTWPMWTTRTLPWVSRSRGPRADRTLTSYRAAVAPRIAHCTPALGESVQRAVEEASLALARFEGASTRGGTVLAPIADLLMRGEMVASSRIESVNAPLDMVAAASLGVRVHVNARLVAAAGDATRALSDVADRRHLEADDLLSAHRTLLAPLAADVEEQVGRLRSVQNWIGGSDYSPRGALHVPPPADEIAADVDDLIVFLRRQDLPALAQAAIAHAQFEGIHPFVDGNGRVGRALIHAVVRRRGLTRQVTVPVAAAMMAQGQRCTRAHSICTARAIPTPLSSSWPNRSVAPPRPRRSPAPGFWHCPRRGAPGRAHDGDPPRSGCSTPSWSIRSWTPRMRRRSRVRRRRPPTALSTAWWPTASCASPWRANGTGSGWRRR